MYKSFMDWCRQNATNSMIELILLVYFNKISKNAKSSTLWPRWSMLRITLLFRYKIDIASYQQFFLDFAAD